MSDVRLGIDGVEKDSGGGTHLVNAVVFRWNRASTIARFVRCLKSSRENEELSRF
jgi:hypothetical protein